MAKNENKGGAVVIEGAIADVQVPGVVGGVVGVSSADAKAAAVAIAAAEAKQVDDQIAGLRQRLANVESELQAVGDARAESQKLTDEVEKLERGHRDYLANQMKKIGEARDKRDKFHYSADTQARIVRRRQLLEEKARLEQTLVEVVARQ